MSHTGKFTLNSIWLESIEAQAAVLRAKSAAAAVLNHAGEKGGARESFFAEFLTQFLPQSVGVGRGEVFDREGNRSKQIDVVVYDRRFAIPNVQGETKLYPVESVIATIEVKSALNSTSAVDALANCLSVATLRPSMIRVQLGDQSTSAAPSITSADFEYIYPSTYVFGLEGYASRPELLLKVAADFLATNYTACERLPFPLLALPRVMVTPTTFVARSSAERPVRSKDEKTDLIAAVADSALAIFVADLLEQVLRRTASLSFDPVLTSTWLPSQVLEFAPGFWLDGPEMTVHAAKLLPSEPPPFAELEHQPYLQVKASGLTVESCPDGVRWVREEGVFQGQLLEVGTEYQVQIPRRLDTETTTGTVLAVHSQSIGRVASIGEALWHLNRFWVASNREQQQQQQ